MWGLQRAAAIAILLLGPGGAAGAAPDGGLPRRGFMGVMVRPPLPDVPAEAAGIVVTRAIPGSTAERLGLQPDDVIMSVDGAPIESTTAFVAAVGGRLSGAEMTFTFRRGEAVHERTIELGAFPRETLAHSDVLYDAVHLPAGGRLRTIVTRPKAVTGRAPAVLFVQGLGCATMDLPFAGDDDTWMQLIRGTAAAGYVTMRVEKSGLGDSEDPPCSEIDFETELAGYRAGLVALRQYDFVDRERVAIFGHSMGGVMAPLLARDVPVAGVAVYGTIAKNFLEYLIENRRRQLPRGETEPVSADASMRIYHEFMVRFVVDDLTPGEIGERYPHLAGVVEFTDETHFFGRHASFFQQLQDIRQLEAWAALDAHVLAIHGEYDWVSTRADHVMIADVVNARHPGRARFVGLEGLDHAFTAHATLEDSYRDYPDGTRTAEPLETLVAWMKSVERELAAQ